MSITKTDFKEYLICPKWLWVKKNKPELCEEGEMSLFLKKLIQDGYEVEEFAQKLFPGGVEVRGNKTDLKERTRELLEQKQTMFQATFETDDGLFAKVDALAYNDESGKWDLYEVKASSGIKVDLKHNHIKDATFQTIVAEKSGVDIDKTYIIHINKKYKREGDIEPDKLFVTKDVSEKVVDEKEGVQQQIDEALALLEKDDIDMSGCKCLYRSHGQRCDCFGLFNPEVPEYSVHHIVQGNKLRLLLNDGILDVKDMPTDFNLTDNQQAKVDLQQTGASIIDTSAIQEVLEGLEYPLYFLDYETLGKPYPILNGYSANQQIVFQYSLHVLQKDGSLEHHEYLAQDFETATKELLEHMKENIGPKGSVLVWFENFEKGRNEEMADIHPEYADFLHDINERIFDLMLIFKKYYLHPDFYGSASIKKVLPVMLPDLSYKDLEVQDGTMALSEWEKTVKTNISDEDKQKIRENLLEYCKLDTLAMVELFKKLKEV